MKIEHWKYEGVAEDGTCIDGGSVVITPKIQIERGSRAKEGFYSPELGQQVISRSDVANPFWISISTGRQSDGTMQGMTAYFVTLSEMERFLSEGIA
jgi:hypothetical protein